MDIDNYDYYIIQIGDYLVSSELITEFFACDYEVCKGACCVEGDSGAPLEEAELEEIERNYDIFSPLMSQAGRDAVTRSGFFEVDEDGSLVTPLVSAGAECAYTCFEGGKCLCAMERKWFEGEGTFRKPASCHLYPIRVSDLGNGKRAVNLHRWDICKCAFEKGRRENIRVYEFLDEPIRLYFGSEFHTALKLCAERLL